MLASGPVAGFAVAAFLVFISGYLTARVVERRNRRRAAARAVAAEHRERNAMVRLVKRVMDDPHWRACPQSVYNGGNRYPCTRPSGHTGAHDTQAPQKAVPPNAA